MTGTALILGASGKLGGHAASAFKQAGWQVRNYDRTGGGMTAAARGVDVIVNGLNPPNYHNWAELIPAITRQVIAAAKASGATVIVPGNVYNFGTTPGTWSEDTTQRPTTRKGQIRVDMENAYRGSGVQTIVLRAGNFIDPTRDDDVMGIFHLRAIAKGKLTLAGAPDVMQAYCYLPDWARAAVQLAERRETLATFEDIPFPGHAFTGNDLKALLESLTGRPIRLTRFPWWAMRLLSPFLEVTRELLEMRPLWETSHRLSDQKFNRLLPDFHATSLAEVIATSLPVDMQDQRRADGLVPAKSL